MRAFVLFLTILCMSAGPSSAIIYTGLVSDPLGMDILSDRIVVTEGSSPSAINHFYWDGGGSASLAMFNISNYCEDVAVFGNYYFIVLTDGRVYRVSKPSGLLDFGLTSSKLYLGDVDSSSISRCIAVDGTGNVYVGGGNTLWKFTYPAYTMSSVWTIPDTYTTQIQSLANHPDGLLLGCGYPAGGLSVHIARVYLWNGDSATKIYEHSSGWPYHTDVAENNIYGIYAVSNKDVYFVQTGHWADTNSNYGSSYWKNIIRLNATDSYSSSSVVTLTTYYTDMVVDSSGIIYLSSSSADSLETFSTVGAVGGYVPSGSYGGTGSSTTTNPLVDYDGDGVFTQEDAKQFSLNIGPVSWILMLFLFLMVALGAKI